MLALPYQDSSFDVILLCGMLEALPHDRKEEAVREAVRALRPEGRLYLTTLNRRYWRYRTHTSKLTYEELDNLLQPWFHVEILGFNPLPPFPYFLPNSLLSHVPYIWPILIKLMEWEIGKKYSCSFLVHAIKR